MPCLAGWRDGEGLSLVRSACEGAGEGEEEEGGGRREGGHDYQVSVTGLVVTGLDWTGVSLGMALGLLFVVLSRDRCREYCNAVHKTKLCTNGQLVGLSVAWSGYSVPVYV